MQSANPPKTFNMETELSASTDIQHIVVTQGAGFAGVECSLVY